MKRQGKTGVLLHLPPVLVGRLKKLAQLSNEPGMSVLCEKSIEEMYQKHPMRHLVEASENSYDGQNQVEADH